MANRKDDDVNVCIYSSNMADRDKENVNVVQAPTKRKRAETSGSDHSHCCVPDVPLTNDMTSDKDITGRSGIISLLDPNDSVMMEKGFVIADLLEKVPASYAIPPFSQMNCQQFEENKVTETKYSQSRNSRSSYFKGEPFI